MFSFEVPCALIGLLGTGWLYLVLLGEVLKHGTCLLELGAIVFDPHREARTVSVLSSCLSLSPAIETVANVLKFDALVVKQISDLLGTTLRVEINKLRHFDFNLISFYQG